LILSSFANRFGLYFAILARDIFRRVKMQICNTLISESLYGIQQRKAGEYGKIPELY
jgi:hypothetical protein